jgi:hypothetical protein
MQNLLLCQCLIPLKNLPSVGKTNCISITKEMVFGQNVVAVVTSVALTEPLKIERDHSKYV